VNRLILAAWLGLAAAAARLRGWSDLALATWNVGPAKHLPAALVDGDGNLLVDVIAIQEGGDQYDAGGIVAQLRAAGYKIITGAEPGQSSTPLSWNPHTLRLVRVKRYLLAARQPVGPGAGPDTLKEKWAIGGLFEHIATGRRFWVFDDHFVASQQHHRRWLVARAMAGRLALLGHRLRHALFDMGDKNAKPGASSLAPLRAAGWLLNQTVGRMLGTHGRRAIDQIWWSPRRWIRFLRHQAIATGSDHKLLIAHFALKPRRRPKENR
jgi:hypothetical protein